MFSKKFIWWNLAMIKPTQNVLFIILQTAKVLCVKADRVPPPWACPYYSRGTSTVTCNRDLLCQLTCRHARHKHVFIEDVIVPSSCGSHLLVFISSVCQNVLHQNNCVCQVWSRCPTGERMRWRVSPWLAQERARVDTASDRCVQQVWSHGVQHRWTSGWFLPRHRLIYIEKTLLWYTGERVEQEG